MDQPSPATPSALARDHGRIMQARRDQHITEIAEYHAHYHAEISRAAPQERSGPDSVRVPLVAWPLAPVRDRGAVREPLIQACAETATSGDTHVLYGMPGCGKTAVAQTVFDEAVRDHGLIGLWVNATTVTSFHAGMLGVAADRGASPQELDAARSGSRPPADLVWHYLDRSPERWLLVLDNADDPAVLRQGWLRPSRRGTVLITTRHGDAAPWRQATRHPLDVLDLRDAVDVLLDLAPDAADRAAVEKLARRLGCHPLALVLAGSFLGRQILEPVTVDDYLRRLQDDPSAVLDQGAAPDERDLRRLVSSTWQLSLDALTRQGVPQATTLLRLLSCFAPEPLPVGILFPSYLDTTGLPNADPPLPGSTANEALNGLVSQSLASLLDAPGDQGRPAVRSVQAHALLLDTVAARIPLDQRDVLLTSAAGLLAQVVAPRNGVRGGAGPYVDGQTLRLFVPHALALLRRATAARSGAAADGLDIVRGLRDQSHVRGDFPTAHLLADAASTAGEDGHGGDALTDRYELARALVGLGRYAEAVDLHRAVLQTREELLGPDHPDTLASAHALGLALYGLGRWEEDERCMRRAAEGRARVLGTDHPDTIESTACLAEAVGEQQRWAEAEALARPNLTTSERALGTDHLRTLLSRIALAWIRSRQGEWGEAESLARTTITGSERTLGADHPRTLAARDLLAGVLIRQGRWAEAEEAARTVLTARERILGPDHPHTLAIQTRLARVLIGRQRPEAALALTDAALETYERVLGRDHPLTAECQRTHDDALSAPAPTPEPGDNEDTHT
ncbi:tetratricopeptide repeat protein [Streptomyces sp. NPDC054933]